MERREFDRKNEVESFLSHYDTAKAILKSMELELKNIEETIIGSIDYSKDSTGKTNKFNSEVENLINKKETLTTRLGNLKKYLDKVEIAMDTLDEVERKVIDFKVIQGKYYYEFADKLKITPRKAQSIKTKVIDKMVSIIYADDSNISCKEIYVINM